MQDHSGSDTVTTPTRQAGKYHTENSDNQRKLGPKPKGGSVRNGANGKMRKRANGQTGEWVNGPRNSYTGSPCALLLEPLPETPVPGTRKPETEIRALSVLAVRFSFV